MKNKETNMDPLEKLKKFIGKFRDIYDCLDLTLLVHYLFQVMEKNDKDINKLKIERIIDRKDYH